MPINDDMTLEYKESMILQPLKQMKKKAVYYSIFSSSLSSLLFGISLTSFNIIKAISSKTYTPGILSFEALSVIATANIFLGGLLANIFLLYNSNFKSKVLILYSSLAILIGYFISYLYPHIYVISISRIILGIGSGISCFAVPAYNYTLSPPSQRGLLSSVHPIFINLGIILGQALTIFDTEEKYNIGYFIILCLAVVTTFSQLFLINIDFEKETIDEENKTIKDLFKHKDSRKSILVVSIFHLSQHLSGIDYVSIFLSKVLKNTSNPYLYTILILSISVPSTLLSSYFLDLYGRKPMMMASCILVGLSTLSLALFSYPSLSIIVYIIGYNIGLSNVPWLISNELSPPSYSPPITSIGILTNWSSAYLCVILIVNLHNTYKDKTWFLYTVLMLLICLFTITFVKETKGKDSHNFM